LDDSIGHTFVSGGLTEASFALIGFQASRMEKAVCLRQEHTTGDTKVWPIPSSNCAARFVLAE